MTMMVMTQIIGSSIYQSRRKLTMACKGGSKGGKGGKGGRK